MEVHPADELEVSQANQQIVKKQRDEAFAELQNAQKEKSAIEKELKNAQGMELLIQGSSAGPKSLESFNTQWKKSQNFVMKSNYSEIKRHRYV
jgi:uncharacterized protein (DUF3084 family)